MGSWREVQAELGSEAPPGRGGAGCVAIGKQRILVYGGADRTPTAFGDWWLLELGESGAHWTRISPVVKLSAKRKLLPRSGASLTYLPAGDGSGEGKVLVYGGQEPVAGVMFDDLLCLDTASWELTDVQLVAPAAAAQQQAPAPLAGRQAQQRQQQEQQEQQPRRPPRPPARHSHVAGVYEQRGLVIFGGAGLRGPLADVWVWQPEATAPDSGSGSGSSSSASLAGSWRCLSDELAEDECPDAREMAAGAMISDAGLLVHGGRGADGLLLNDIGIFDGRAGRWVLLQATGHARCAHTACNATSSGDCSASAASAGTAAAGGASGGGSSNVLLYGGFTGEAVAGDLLQLTFLRQQRSSGAHGLRAELRLVKAAAEAAPPPRFAHGAAVLSGPGAAEMVVVGGVNQTDDLADVHVWTV
ncbi:hypothetical protein ABPG75_007956 [Micractinium tetrahymenae]